MSGGGYGGGQGGGQGGGSQGGFSGFGPATVSQMPGGGQDGGMFQAQMVPPGAIGGDLGNPIYAGKPEGNAFMARGRGNLGGGYGTGVVSSRDLNLNTGLPSMMGTLETGFMPTEQFMSRYGGGFGGGYGGFSGMPPPNYNVYDGRPGGFSRGLGGGFAGGQSISGDMVSPAINVAAPNQPPPPAPAPAPNQGYNAAGTRFRNLSAAAQPVQAQRIQDTPMPDQTMQEKATNFGVPESQFNYGRYGTLQDLYANNPFGLPAGFSWDRWTQATGNVGARDPRYLSTSGDRLPVGYDFYGSRNYRGMREGGIATLLKKKK